MSKSALRRQLEGLYGALEEYDVIAGAVSSKENYIRKKEYPRLEKELSDKLSEYEYLISSDRFSRIMREINERLQLEDGELLAAGEILSEAVLRRLAEPASASSSSKTELLQTREFENCVQTLRMVRDFDFGSLYEELSGSERILRSSYAYRISDQRTKAVCRAKIFSESERTGKSTYDTAKKAIEDESLFSSSHKAAGHRYLPCVIILTAVLTAVAAVLCRSVILTLLSVLPLSEAAKRIVGRIYTAVIPPEPVPSVDEEYIGAEAMTLTVIAALLGDDNEKLFGDIEKAYLSNPQSGQFFGILGDLKDSQCETADNDSRILKDAGERICALNEKYGGRFYLFVRRRIYSRSEEAYIAFDRKRGAVLELMRLLRGKETTFAAIEGDRSVFPKIKYVITLDSDTRMPVGGVRALTAKMEHPHNRPHISGGRVVSGYGAMQPRMQTSLHSSRRTLFSLLENGNCACSLYQTASFDILQSVFGAGCFCGKGIMNVDVYLEVLDNAFPPERILSHDLLEGERLRCAAATDICFTDSFPKHPIAYFIREHRWIRGDTQAIPFAVRNVINASGERMKNPISVHSRIILWDNLRMPLVRVSSAAALAASAFAVNNGGGWSAFASILYLAIDAAFGVVCGIPGPGRRFDRLYIQPAIRAVLCFFYELSALFFRAWTDAGAVILGILRSRPKGHSRLEWVTSPDGDLSCSDIFSCLQKTGVSVLAGTALLIFTANDVLRAVFLLWALYPIIVRILALSPRPRSTAPAQMRACLNKYAYDQWKYFGEHVNEETNWLPPDHIRLYPEEFTADYTSPTNVGLYLLSCIAAFKFSCINEDELYMRCAGAIRSIERLPKWHGHLYNWFSVSALTNVGVSYISSVDSGNFVTALIAFAGGLREISADDSRFAEFVPRIENIISNTDFMPLYNKEKKLFSHGYNVSAAKLDGGCYDLLMSECRALSYYAVARGIVPPEHWRRLRRPSLKSGGYTGMASWTGTMFEYMMPALLLPVYEGSLEWESLSFALREQRRSGIRRLWGRSESAYYSFDAGGYRYRAIGVSSLALKGKNAEEPVFSPYSAFLASAIAPRASAAVLDRMKKAGLYGKYGFYESIDMSPARSEDGEAVVKSYMSHHVGMSIAAAANVCYDGMFRRWFMADMSMASASALIEEEPPCRSSYAAGRIAAQDGCAAAPDPDSWDIIRMQ